MTVQVAVPVPLERLFSYEVPAELGEARVGCRVIVPFGARTLTGVVVGLDPPEEPNVALKQVSHILDTEPLFDPAYLRLARWVAAQYLASIGEVLSAMLPGARRGRDLPERSGDEPAVAATTLSLSAEQQAALDTILSPVVAAGPDGAASAPEAPDDAPARESTAVPQSDPPRRWFYLYGITGSGKTEVFLRAAERTLAAGRSVIYLVPEIALTHQLFAHIQGRFGSTAAMLHSGLTPAQRLGEWQRIRSGEARLVIGARSAVFAPVRELGLVVIDEEHESSYKAGSSPRYHARQVALWRAREAGAVCVMGSATPSVEAWHLMAEGTLQRLTLTQRLSGGQLPLIRVQDLRRSPSLLSAPLLTALRETRAAGAQSILFLNRRGFASVLLCRSCGYQADCPHCSVPMTWHKGRGRLVCHYCGHQVRPPSVCPSCSSLDIGMTGFGTERIEEDLARDLPELSVARLDTDVTARKGALRETLDSFARGETDVLLGTQMVAKGLNFPGVRTVGIVMADTGLSMPDFRAAERSFALIVQVAGRAGRFRTDGEVIVQTMRPEHPAIRHATRMEVDAFYREELAIRRELGFPPFARLLRCVVRATRREDAEQGAEQLAVALRAIGGEGSEGDPEILGPAPAPLERVNRSWRFQVLLRGSSAAGLTAMLRAARDGLRLPRAVYLEVDVDPVNLL